MKDGNNIPRDTHFQKRLVLNQCHNKVGGVCVCVCSSSVHVYVSRGRLGREGGRQAGREQMMGT